MKRLLSLPYSSIEKAIQVLDMHLDRAEEKIRINAEVKGFTKHLLSIRQWVNFLRSEDIRTIVTARFFASQLNELAGTLEDLIRSKIPIAYTHCFSMEKAIGIFGVLKNTPRTLVRGCF